jgi:hypothetical protein
MATDATPAPPTAPSNRPRPFLLVLLGLVAAAGLYVYFGPSASNETAASNPRRPQQQGTTAKDAPLDPAALDVHLEALKTPAPAPGDSERNPFRFRPAPPPPPPPEETRARPLPTQPEGPPQPPPPPPVPPIPLKFIGLIDEPGGGKLAAFSDCRYTYRGREGQIIAGQYRLVKIGVESVTLEYLDGKGQTTIRMGAPECVK